MAAYHLEMSTFFEALSIIFLVVFIYAKIEDQFGYSLGRFFRKLFNRRFQEIPEPSISGRGSEVKNYESPTDYKTFSTRAFLNLPKYSSDAYVSIRINKDGEKAYHIDIKSCHENILLHGTLSNPDSHENALFKINTLIANLELAKQFMMEQGVLGEKNTTV